MKLESVVTVEHSTTKNMHRTQSEPVLYSTRTDVRSVDEPAVHGVVVVGGCEESVTSQHGLSVNNRDSVAAVTSADATSHVDVSQYVALDCEFVGVGSRNSSALGALCSLRFIYC